MGLQTLISQILAVALFFAVIIGPFLIMRFDLAAYTAGGALILLFVFIYWPRRRRRKKK